MPEFLQLTPPQEALNRLLNQMPAQPRTEWIDLLQAPGRVTAEPVLAPHPLPTFTRSTVDGYALRAADTYGASSSIPAYLKVVDEVLMGSAPRLSISPTTCAMIHTGGMLPKGTDAVVMLEYTQPIASDEIEVLRAVAVGENVIREGEDVRAGEEVIAAGTVLRPVEIGGLAALGVQKILVNQKPRVALLSTGDEILPIEAELAPGKVHDVNTFSLSALVQRAGGDPVSFGILPDQADALRKAATLALGTCDVVIITAGSSASARDLTAQIITGLGKPGILVHGVAVRPGKPTILALCAPPGKPPKVVIGLPGNPVSAYVIAGLFVVPVIQRLLKVSRPALKPCIQAHLTLNITSETGRDDWVPVRLSHSPAGWQAEPVFGKSNLIFTLARADGIIHIPSSATGLHIDDLVEVYPLQ